MNLKYRKKIHKTEKNFRGGGGEFFLLARIYTPATKGNNVVRIFSGIVKKSIKIYVSHFLPTNTCWPSCDVYCHTYPTLINNLNRTVLSSWPWSIREDVGKDIVAHASDLPVQLAHVHPLASRLSLFNLQFKNVPNNRSDSWLSNF